MKTKLTILIATLSAASSLLANPIQYTGSDFFEGPVETALKENAKKSQVELKGKFYGSKFGIEQLRKGLADFGLIMLQDPNTIPEIKEKKWRAIPFAYQVTYVATSRANPIDKISFKELSSLFARFSPQKHIELWEEFPSANGKIYGKIILLAGTGSDNASASFFQSIIFPQSDFHRDVRFIKTDELILRELSETANGIAILGTPISRNNPAIKTLAVSAQKDEKTQGIPYSPTEVNIYNQDYPLSIPLYIVYPNENREKLIPTLKIIFSDEFTESLKKSAFMPIPKNIRQNVKKSIDEKNNK